MKTLLNKLFGKKPEAKINRCAWKAIYHSSRPTFLRLDGRHYSYEFGACGKCDGYQKLKKCYYAKNEART